MERIAFKPLSTSPVEISDDEDEDEEEDLFNIRTDRTDRTNRINYKFERFQHQINAPGWLCGRYKYSDYRPARIRVALLVTFLCVALILILFERHNNVSLDISSHEAIKDIQPLANALQSKPTSILNASAVDLSLSLPSTLSSRLPRNDSKHPYDTYLTSLLGESDAFVEVPYDDLGAQKAKKPWWQVIMKNKEQYITVTNYIRAHKSFNYNTSITLTTQASTNFLHHTVELCKRWDGPISVAVFCPGPDLTNAITLIKFMRQCLPPTLNACIRDKVTWHLVYNKSRGPSSKNLDYPNKYLDNKRYGLFSEHDQCPKFAGPQPIDLVRQFEEALRANASTVHPLYPINVLRNTARLAAKTHYVLASDIELYPSINLVPMFSNYLIKHGISNKNQSLKKNVFTLPIFEVSANCTPPKTKSELIDLFQERSAIFFHKYVCDPCQNFPNRSNWLQHNDNENPDEISIFTVTKRDKSKNSWEPIYIGTNDDPLYEERMSWDGRRDKMSQMYETCLLDYNFLVLGNCFLVHAPGIKHIVKDDIMKRTKFMTENNAIYDETISKLKNQYSNSETIKSC